MKYASKLLRLSVGHSYHRRFKMHICVFPQALNLIFMTKLDGIVLDLFSIFEAEQATRKIVQDYSSPFFNAWFELTLNLQLKASHPFWKYIFSCFLSERYQWVSEAKHSGRLKINPQKKSSQLKSTFALEQKKNTSTWIHDIYLKIRKSHILSYHYW